MSYLEMMHANGSAVKAGGLLYLPEGLVFVERVGTGERDGLVIPKGGPKPGDEHLRHTAVRELYEETGFRAEAGLFLGNLTRGSIDTESPEDRKTIEVFLMDKGEQDLLATPEETVRVVDPYAVVFENIMRYPEEAAFVVRHLPVVLRSHSWR